ncbi:hypothetical protein WMY93_028342 [Mugilogobius chulae]|uniref:Senescence domain-containing protein n=1 Tax=Mugilogobius chulae TaxID=88201 RepID=A0AAW0N0A1_9GOBI
MWSTGRQERGLSEPLSSLSPSLPRPAQSPRRLPPAYSPQVADGHVSLSYGTDSGEMSAVGEEFYSQRSSPSPQSVAWEDGEQLLYLPHGVQIFFVTPEGNVSAPSYPSFLRLVKFTHEATDRTPNRPPAFLQSEGVLAPQVPAEARAAEGEEGEEQGEEDKTLPEWSEKVAHGIITGASWLSWGLVKGAEFTGKAIHKGASKLREHITPEDRPMTVSPTVTKSLQVAKQATGAPSKSAMDGVCTVTGFVGRELAPHVKKHGQKLIPESMKKDKDGRSNIDGAMVVAASGVQGFATMWTGLEVAAKNIATSVATETVSTVKHKYGAEAGQATDHAVNSAMNVGLTAFNIDNLGIKAVVKKTAKRRLRLFWRLQGARDAGE